MEASIKGASQVRGLNNRRMGGVVTKVEMMAGRRLGGVGGGERSRCSIFILLNLRCLLDTPGDCHGGRATEL